MQFLAFEQLNHNPESPRDTLFAANIEYNVRMPNNVSKSPARDCIAVQQRPPYLINS
jgi:hypothetical protein